MALGVDNGPRQGFELDNLQATILDAAYDDVRFELTIWASEDRDNVVLRYTYASNLFTEDAIRRANLKYRNLIDLLCARAEMAVGVSSAVSVWEAQDVGRQLSSIRSRRRIQSIDPVEHRHGTQRNKAFL
jgi:hypothetical protein